MIPGIQIECFCCLTNFGMSLLVKFTTEKYDAGSQDIAKKPGQLLFYTLLIFMHDNMYGV